MKPILLNTEMVRAILDGRKTVTRRVIKPQPDECHKYFNGFVSCSTEPANVGCAMFSIFSDGGCSCSFRKPKYRPGDVLWVRETWLKADDGYHYKADVKVPSISEDLRKEYGYKWRPSIHMPKEAARIFLKVTGVRVERLQDITVDGVKFEGIELDYPLVKMIESKHLKEFISIWDGTIKKQDLDTYGWAANPWVWVYEFERIEKGED